MPPLFSDKNDSIRLLRYFLFIFFIADVAVSRGNVKVLRPYKSYSHLLFSVEIGSSSSIFALGLLFTITRWHGSARVF